MIEQKAALERLRPSEKADHKTAKFWHQLTTILYLDTNHPQTNLSRHDSLTHSQPQRLCFLSTLVHTQILGQSGFFFFHFCRSLTFFSSENYAFGERPSCCRRGEHSHPRRGSYVYDIWVFYVFQKYDIWVCYVLQKNYGED